MTRPIGDGIADDLRHAARALFRTPALSTVVLATLGLGVGITGAMFAVVDRLFFRAPAEVVAPREVASVSVTRAIPGEGRITGGIGNFPRYEELARTRSGAAAAYFDAELSVGAGPDARRIETGMVTGSFFSLLGIHPALGRLFGDDEDREGTARPPCVLSDRLWRTAFGAQAAVLGTTLPVEGGGCIVVGVLPPRFDGLSLRPRDLWLPIHPAIPTVMGPRILACGRCDWPLEMIARLAPGADRRSSAAQMSWDIRHGSEFPGDSGVAVSLSGLTDLLRRGDTSESAVAMWLAAVCIVVLGIVCANLANLLLMRTLQRRRELAVRAALGASTYRLLRHVAAEVAILGAVGGGFAILAALWAAPLLHTALLPDGGPAGALDGRTLAFIGATTMAVMLIAAAAALSQAASMRLAPALKESPSEHASSWSRTRTTLVTVQVGLTVLLLSGASLFLASLHNIMKRGLGFDADHVIAITVDASSHPAAATALAAIYADMARQVSGLAGVAGSSLAAGSPFGSASLIPVSVPGHGAVRLSDQTGPFGFAVDPNYFRAMGTPIESGRGFTPDDRPGADLVVMVNRTMARTLWPDGNPLGECLTIGEGHSGCSRVIGIVDDARVQDVRETNVMQYFVPLAQAAGAGLPTTPDVLLVRARTTAEAMLAPVHREIANLAPSLPIRINPMPRVYAEQLRVWRTGSELFTMFGVVGLVLAAVGLYGLLSYAVSLRVRELGVRTALGATSSDLVSLVVGQGVRITLFGLALGVAAAIGANRMLVSLLYGISPSDPRALAAVAIVLLGVALLASWLPARRAARVDPMTALRYE